jgi:hypothetical protein
VDVLVLVVCGVSPVPAVCPTMRLQNGRPPASLPLVYTVQLWVGIFFQKISVETYVPGRKPKE